MTVTYIVYRDGILLSAASKPQFQLHSDIVLPVPRLLVNLPKITSQKIDLSRSKILGQSEHWDATVYQTYQNFILRKSLKDLLELQPAERLYKLGRLIAFYNIQPENLLQIFPIENLPLPFLEAGGHLDILEWDVAANDAIYGYPEYFAIQIETALFGSFDVLNPIYGELSDLSLCQWFTHNKYDGLLTQWTGERCLIFDLDVEGRISSIREARRL